MKEEDFKRGLQELPTALNPDEIQALREIIAQAEAEGIQDDVTIEEIKAVLRVIDFQSNLEESIASSMASLGVDGNVKR